VNLAVPFCEKWRQQQDWQVTSIIIKKGLKLFKVARYQSTEMSPGKRILLHFFSSNGRLPNSDESQSMLLEINNELQAAGVRALDLFTFND
jgi:hypothetical protein